MENKFRDFLNKWNGRHVEVVDPTNKNQCFDLAVAFLDFLKLPRSFNHYFAYSIYTNPTNVTKENFDLIPNTTDAKPKAGDIVVWGKSFNGTAGHVAIATGEGKTEGKYTDWFGALSQNDPLGSVCIVKNYKFNHVLGWLRYKKGEQIMENCEEIKKQLKEKTELETELRGIVYEKQGKIETKDKTIDNLNRRIDDVTANTIRLSDEKKALAKKLTLCRKEVSTDLKCYEELIEAKQKVKDFKIIKQTWEETKQTWIDKEIEYNKQIKTLQTRIDNIKSPLKVLLTNILEAIKKMAKK